jgi:hypothetical protein
MTLYEIICRNKVKIITCLNNSFYCIRMKFCEKLVSLDVHIKVLIEQTYIDIIRCIYMNLHDLLNSYAGKN